MFLNIQWFEKKRRCLPSRQGRNVETPTAPRRKNRWMNGMDEWMDKLMGEGGMNGYMDGREGGRKGWTWTRQLEKWKKGGRMGAMDGWTEIVAMSTTGNNNHRAELIDRSEVRLKNCLIPAPDQCWHSGRDAARRADQPSALHHRHYHRQRRIITIHTRPDQTGWIIVISNGQIPLSVERWDFHHHPLIRSLYNHCVPKYATNSIHIYEYNL